MSRATAFVPEHEEGEASAAASAPPAVSYYYSDAAKGALGPCQLTQLRVLWVSGHIGRDTSVWREGLGSWLPIYAFPEVSDALLPLAQPPSAGAEATPWYHLDANGERSTTGQSAEAIGNMVASGELDGMSLVWREGMAQWAELGQVGELRAILLRADPDDDEDELPPEQQVFDPHDDLDAARRTRDAAAAKAKPPKKGAGEAGAPSSSAAGEAAGAASADGEAKAKRVRKKKPKFKADGGSSIYVSGLPDDTDQEELLEWFRVAGLLKTDPGSGAPKLKMYMDEGGKPKGDALLTFAKAESVSLAVTLRDGYEVRPGRTLAVQPAKFEQRGDALAPQRRLGKEETQHRKKQRLLEQRQLREWDDELAGGAGNRTVVLAGLFSEEEAASEGADFYANLKTDIEVECKKAGALDKVHIFEGSEKGAAAVKFKSPEDAQRCVAMMNERRFGGAQISCVFYDGVTDYRAKRLQEAAAHPAAESVEEQEKNLTEYADWLEANSTDDEIAADDD